MVIRKARCPETYQRATKRGYASNAEPFHARHPYL
jgi:hypothetical protein